MMKIKSFREFLGEAKENKEINVVTFDIPLFIRMMELSREDLKDDESIHFITQNLIKLMQSNEVLTMDNYKDIISVLTKSN